MSIDFSPIRKLAASDPVDAFDCGQSDLNRYLQRYAWNNQKANSAQPATPTASAPSVPARVPGG